MRPQPPVRSPRARAPFRAPARTFYALTLALCLVAAPGCGSDASTPATVTSLCTVPESKCIGQTLATCAQDGKAWAYTNCLPGSYCAPSGACAQGKCAPSSGSCTGGQLVECSANGSSQAAARDCGASEVCAAGACLPATCTDGDVRCGDPYTLATCQGGAWTATPCGAGQICGDTDGAAACVDRACAPGAARCDGDDSYVCDAIGAGETKTTCASPQICKSGFCQAKVAGVDDLPEGDATSGDVQDDAAATDTTGTDVKEVFIPPLEKISFIEAKFAGVKTKFDFNGRADYIAVDQNLKMSAGLSGRKLEINIAPIDKFNVGKWTDTDEGEVGVVICYYDGGLVAGGAPGCPEGFSHGSVLYDLTLATNNGPGSRLTGSFSATLRTPAGEEIEVTEGNFDVLFQ